MGSENVYLTWKGFRQLGIGFWLLDEALLVKTCLNLANAQYDIYIFIYHLGLLYKGYKDYLI